MFQRALNLLLSLSLIVATPVGAAPTNAEPQNTEDLQRLYWGQLGLENPLLSEFALGEPLTEDNKPLWVIGGDNPLLKIAIVDNLRN